MWEGDAQLVRVVRRPAGCRVVQAGATGVCEEGSHLAMAQGTDGGSSSGSLPFRQASCVPQVGQQPRAVHLQELLCGLQVDQCAVQGLLEVRVFCLGRTLQQKGRCQT